MKGVFVLLALLGTLAGGVSPCLNYCYPEPCNAKYEGSFSVPPFNVGSPFEFRAWVHFPTTDTAFLFNFASTGDSSSMLLSYSPQQRLMSFVTVRDGVVQSVQTQVPPETPLTGWMLVELLVTTSWYAKMKVMYQTGGGSTYHTAYAEGAVLALPSSVGGSSIPATTSFQGTLYNLWLCDALSGPTIPATVTGWFDPVPASSDCPNGRAVTNHHFDLTTSPVTSSSQAGGHFTFSVWVKFFQHTYWARIFELGNAPLSGNLVLATDGLTGWPTLHTYIQSESRRITIKRPISLFDWVKLEGHTSNVGVNTVGLLKMTLPDGTVKEETGMAYRLESFSRTVWLGKSTWEGDARTVGKVSDFKICFTN